MEHAAASVAERTADLLASLSRAERQVGRVLLSDYPSAGLSTVAGLAQQAHVSPPTVLRFAQSLGFSGFAEMQKLLRDELTASSSGPLRRLARRAESGSTREVLLRHAADQSAVALDSLGRVPEHSYEATVALLTDPAKRVVTVGGRFSQLLARHLGMHLKQLRPGVRMIDDPYGGDLGTLIDLGQRDVVVLFDFHRYQSSALELAGIARRRGAHLVLVTDGFDCPATPMADIVLNVSSTTVQVFQSMTAAFMLTEQLVHLVVERLGEPAATRLALWDRHRAQEVLP